jgi:hypothetical protein
LCDQRKKNPRWFFFLFFFFGVLAVSAIYIQTRLTPDVAMLSAEVTALWTACLGDLVCKHLFDQELLNNSTRFDVVARTLIPAWPVTFSHITNIVSDPDALRAMYLVSRAASNECGFNRWSPNGQCVFIAPFERPSAVFVNIVFVVFILIALVAGGTYFVKHFRSKHLPVCHEPRLDRSLSNAERNSITFKVVAVIGGTEYQVGTLGTTTPNLDTLPPARANDSGQAANNTMEAKRTSDFLVLSHGLDRMVSQSRRR